MNELPKIRAIIVDDEQIAIDLLQHHLEQECPEVKIIQTFQSSQLAFEQIPLLQPDLLFTDIEMPHLTGLELVAQLNQPRLKVIFVTAYNEFALNAIKLAAADYLLKPVDSQELRTAISKISLGRQEENSIMMSLINMLQTQKNFARLAINSDQSIQFIDYEDISYCKSEGPYTEFFLTNRKTILSSKSLGEYESLLNEQGFFRIHHSYLINLYHLDKFVKKDGGYVIMRDGTSLPVARRKKEDFITKISGQ